MKFLSDAAPNKPFQPTASREIVAILKAILCSALAAAERQAVGRQDLLAQRLHSLRSVLCVYTLADDCACVVVAGGAMAILSYVERLALTDQQARRAALLSILRELEYPFVLCREQIEDHYPENIIVRFGHATPRLVLGAHYDSVPGSIGANDNAASVAILLSLLHSYRHRPPRLPCDIVFFDLEESGYWGAARWSRHATSRCRARPRGGPRRSWGWC